MLGNSPSPAVATYCLRQSVKEGQPDYERFINRNFYVENCLTSLPVVEESIFLFQRTQNILSRSNLRSHKFSSNKNEVMAAFPPHDHTNGLKELDLNKYVLPMQRGLCLLWDLKNYAFTFKVVDMFKPFTRRWVLANINSVYYLLGFASPVTLEMNIILRKHTTEWDSLQSKKLKNPWGVGKTSLMDVDNLQIPRTRTKMSPIKSPI